MSNSLATAGAIFAMFFGWSISMITGNWMYVYYRLYRLDIEHIVNRFPRSALIYGMVDFLSVVIANPISIIAHYFTQPESYILFNLHYILIQFLILSNSVILLLRVWLIYYKVKLYKSMDEEKWFKFIDSAWSDKSWFLSHKSTFGNSNVMSSVTFLVYSITALMCIVINFNEQVNSWQGHRSGSFVRVVMVLQGVIPLAGVCILACIFPKFEDYYQIRNGTVKIVITWFSVSVSLTLLSYFLFGRGFVHRIWLIYVGQAFQHLVLSYILYKKPLKTFGLPSNVFVLRSFDPELFNNLEHSISDATGSLPSQSKLTLSIISRSSEQAPNANANENKQVKKKKKLRIMDVFQNYDLLCMFATHLVSEFAIESLLFVYESYQYQQRLIQRFDVYKDHEPLPLSFAKKLPASMIVEQIKANDKESCVRCLVDLFWKYVNIDSPFTLNISGESRNILYSRFGVSAERPMTNRTEENVQFMCQFVIKNWTDNEMFDVWIENRQEALSLMLQPYARFRDSEAFRAYTLHDLMNHQPASLGSRSED